MLMLLFIIKCKLAHATTMDIAIKVTNNYSEAMKAIRQLFIIILTLIIISSDQKKSSFVVFNPEISELSILLRLALFLSWNIIVIQIISYQQ